MFPDAPFYTTVFDPAKVPADLRGIDVRTSFIQRIPVLRRRHITFLPLMPLAFEQFDLSGYDVVVSLNSACAKGVITSPHTLSLCYCYTPCRYIWDLYHEYTRDQPTVARALFAPVAHRLRLWDRAAADRVDHFVGISHEVAGRIRKHYRRDAEVIYPPVDLERFTPRPDGEDFYLVVSRLVGYKRVDLAVRAATRLGRRLVVVGAGPELARLRAEAGPTVEFRGRLPDEEVAELYARCRAFLFPGLEDFGIAPVEAQAAGRPVIAFGRGGAAETVVHGVTGVLFEEQSVDALVEAILQFEMSAFDPWACRSNAERFGAGQFRRQIAEAIDVQLRRVRPATRHGALPVASEAVHAGSDR
jgi:glycosyltransferase involved in cell wall biosynthesis